MEVSDIIERYQQEADIDTNLDRLSVTETQERLVSNKHKWAARLTNHKYNINKYVTEKTLLTNQLIEEYQNNQPVSVSRNIAEKAIINNKQLVSINFKIENEILIVDFLDKIYKNVSFATNDIKNLAELIRLETQ
jgi:hypothetical protein|tara:strand:+ start:94 stop:498 length:405 start_codon:yes stop_codon:yes gene_type:complete